MPGAPLCLINIAGGVASDSANALLLLRREHPEWIAGREIRIDVLDLDDAGPSFGKRAVASLCAEGAPLSGLDIRFTHHRASWGDRGAIRALGEAARGGLIVASSEGGLFEYGSEEEISTFLQALREAAPDTAALIGSVALDVEMMRMMRKAGKMTIRPRNPESLAPVAARAGWGLEVLPVVNPLYALIRLRPRSQDAN